MNKAILLQAIEDIRQTGLIIKETILELMNKNCYKFMGRPPEFGEISTEDVIEKRRELLQT